MKFGKLCLAGALGIMLTLPAAAQTLQTTPTKPTVTKPTSTMAAPSTAAPSTAAPRSASSIIDINSASADDLDNLPGIGKTRAEAIIKHRPYKGKDDLVNRHIIPPNVYNGIKDKIIAKQG